MIFAYADNVVTRIQAFDSSFLERLHGWPINFSLLMVLFALFFSGCSHVVYLRSQIPIKMDDEVRI